MLLFLSDWHKGQSLKNLSSFVGPLLPRPLFPDINSAKILERLESLTQLLGLNQRSFSECPGPFMAKVETQEARWSSRTLITAALWTEALT